MESSPAVAVDDGPVGGAFDQAWESLSAESEPDQPDAAPPTDPVADAAPAGPARDDRGRFASRDNALPASAAAAEQPPEPPSAESTDEQPPAEAPADEAEAPPPDAQVVYPEFEYTVNGRALNIPGSKVGSDGIFIPTNQSELLARYLSAGRTAEQRARDFGRQLAEAKREAQVEMGRARAILGKIKDAHTTDPQGFADWFSKLDWEKLELQEKVKALESAKTEVTERLSQQEIQAAAQNLIPQLQSSVQRTLQSFASKPEYEGVDFEGLYKDLLGRDFDRVFSEDDSGEVIYHSEYVKERVDYEAAVLARGRKAAAKLVAATKQNQPVVQAQQSGGKKPVAPAKPKLNPDAIVKSLPTTRERVAHVFGDGWKDL